MGDERGDIADAASLGRGLKEAPWAEGVRVLKNALLSISQDPGVYRMIDAKGTILYIGKAKNLKNRVTQYTRTHDLPQRLQRMVSRVRSVEITTTHTEVEALLLEGHLIKKHRPEFNILFKDDKDFPWICLSDHPFPRPLMRRGKPSETRRFGPFASTQAVYTTLDVLYRTFQLRSCSDQIFSHRKRPCLQYHIKRCSAPCVSKISQQAYQDTVHQALQVLQGQNDVVQKQLAQQMAEASEQRAYEKAAVLRDRIAALSTIQSFQKVHQPSWGDTDVIAVGREGSRACITMFFYRQGVYGGYRSYPMTQDPEVPLEDILAAFVIKIYADCPIPETILVSHTLSDMSCLQQALARLRGGDVMLKHPQRGDPKTLVDHALKQAMRDLWKGQGGEHFTEASWEAFQKKWNLAQMPQRIEVYDNSHIQGTSSYGVMIVASPQGFETSSYRSFRIQDPTLRQDDYGMMREVFERRFKGTTAAQEPLPDAIIIDGGKGQWHAVYPVLVRLKLDHIPVIAMAKGPDRHAGREFLYRGLEEPFQLPISDPVLFLMQVLRDEAHRFAITTHRKGRQKSMVRSALDEIQGIGPQKRKQLLHYFGSLDAIQNAAQEDLAKAPGISAALAERIYQALHV